MRIVGEALLRVRHSLIARARRSRSRRSRPCSPIRRCRASARASCARELPHARCCRRARPRRRCGAWWPAGDGASARRSAPRSRRRSTAGTVLREGVEDREDNETRFVWLARDGRAARAAAARPAAASVEDVARVLGRAARAARAGSCAASTSSRAARSTCTKIESRPRRERLGSYMFFADLAGQRERAAVAAGARRAARRSAKRCACSAPTGGAGDPPAPALSAAGAAVRARGACGASAAPATLRR